MQDCNILFLIKTKYLKQNVFVEVKKVSKFKQELNNLASEGALLLERENLDLARDNTQLSKRVFSLDQQVKKLSADKKKQTVEKSQEKADFYRSQNKFYAQNRLMSQALYEANTLAAKRFQELDFYRKRDRKAVMSAVLAELLDKKKAASTRTSPASSWDVLDAKSLPE